MNAHLGYKQLAGILCLSYAQSTDKEAQVLDRVVTNLINELRYQEGFSEETFRDAIFTDADTVNELVSLKSEKELQAERANLRYQVTQGNTDALDALEQNAKALLSLKGL